MPQIQFISHDVHAMLDAEGIALNSMKTLSGMVEALSPADMAEATLIQEKRFPFQDLAQQLDITVADTPLTRLTQDGSYPDLSERIRKRYDTLLLQELALDASFTSVYRLYPVDESFWVVVEQRVHAEDRDPADNLSHNNAFFDALIAQCLQTHHFESVCASKLFTYYLGSLPAAAA